jgi:hypothetical protein
MLSHVMDRINTNQEKTEAGQEQMQAKMMASQHKIKASRSAKQDTVGSTIQNNQEKKEIAINACYERLEAT